MELITIIQLLVLLDFTATHYFMFLMQKKDCFHTTQEKNLIPRLIIGRNPSPWSLLRISIVMITMISIIVIVVPEELRYIILGMYFMLNYYHFLQLKDINNNWANEESWTHYKQMLILENK